MVDPDKMFAHSARLIAAVAKKPLPIASGMGKWFEYCEKVAPERGPLWRRLRKLDFDEDAKILTKWLTRLFAKEPPAKNINGLWFGLYNPELRGGEPTCQMYVGGSAKFSPKSDSDEWVCQLSYSPKGRYSKSAVLAELYRSVEAIEKNNVNYLGEAFLCHGYLALVVSHWSQGNLRATLLGEAAVRAVVIGHDNGDFYRLAILKK